MHNQNIAGRDFKSNINNHHRSPTERSCLIILVPVCVVQYLNTYYLNENKLIFLLCFHASFTILLKITDIFSKSIRDKGLCCTKTKVNFRVTYSKSGQKSSESLELPCLSCRIQWTSLQTKCVCYVLMTMKRSGSWSAIRWALWTLTLSKKCLTWRLQSKNNVLVNLKVSDTIGLLVYNYNYSKIIVLIFCNIKDPMCFSIQCSFL